jgi:hypothetical protein
MICQTIRNPRENAPMTAIDAIRDPVARTRAQCSRDLMHLRMALDEASDPQDIAEIENDIDQVQGRLDSLTMCFG